MFKRTGFSWIYIIFLYWNEQTSTCPSLPMQLRTKPKELEWFTPSPDLDPNAHLWDELEHHLRSARSLNSTSVPDLVYVFFLAEYLQIPKGTLQNLLESLPRKVELILTAKGECIWNVMLNMYIFCFDIQVSTKRWPYSVATNSVKTYHDTLWWEKICLVRIGIYNITEYYSNGTTPMLKFMQCFFFKKALY